MEGARNYSYVYQLCINKEQYDLEKVLTLLIENKQATEKIIKSVAQQYVALCVHIVRAQGYIK